LAHGIMAGGAGWDAGEARGWSDDERYPHAAAGTHGGVRYLSRASWARWWSPQRRQSWQRLLPRPWPRRCCWATAALEVERGTGARRERTGSRWRRRRRRGGPTPTPPGSSSAARVGKGSVRAGQGQYRTKGQSRRHQSDLRREGGEMRRGLTLLSVGDSEVAPLVRSLRRAPRRLANRRGRAVTV